MKGSGELGATEVIDGKGSDAIAKLSVADHRARSLYLTLDQRSCDLRDRQQKPRGKAVVWLFV